MERDRQLRFPRSANASVAALLTVIAATGCGGKDSGRSGAQETTGGDEEGSSRSDSTGTSAESGSEATGEGGTTLESTSDGATVGSWPECAPWDVQPFRYLVGPDDWGNHQPDVQWPAGHHAAMCTVSAWGATPVPDAEGVWSNTVAVEGCVDERGVATPRSLDLVLVMDEALEPPLEEGQTVAVSYSVKIWASYDYQSWYSLRDSETGDLLLAAFADPGPDLAPKVPEEPTLEGWLAPFEASLGSFACPVEQGPFCEGPTPQRAFVDFTREGEVWSVVGGTRAELPGYVLSLGFAGAPDVCDGVPTHLPIHGVLVKQH